MSKFNSVYDVAEPWSQELREALHNKDIPYEERMVQMDAVDDKYIEILKEVRDEQIRNIIKYVDTQIEKVYTHRNECYEDKIARQEEIIRKNKIK